MTLLVLPKSYVVPQTRGTRTNTRSFVQDHSPRPTDNNPNTLYSSLDTFETLHRKRNFLSLDAMPPKRKAPEDLVPDPGARLLPRIRQPISNKIINRLRLDLIVANLEASPVAMALLADPAYESRVLLGEILASWYRRTIVEPEDSGDVPRDVYSVVVSHAARYPERFMLLLEVVEQGRKGGGREQGATKTHRGTTRKNEAQDPPKPAEDRDLVAEDWSEWNIENLLDEPPKEADKNNSRELGQHKETIGDPGPAVVSRPLHPPQPPPPPPPPPPSQTRSSLTPSTDSIEAQQPLKPANFRENKNRCLEAVLTKLSLTPKILSLIPEPDKLMEVEQVLRDWYQEVGGGTLEGSVYAAILQKASSSEKYASVLKAAERRKTAKNIETAKRRTFGFPRKGIIYNRERKEKEVRDHHQEEE
ncbi:hypothetical protein BDD12DRAFT_871543 [Trichophaea hybrida]|nr:hypothetical protein BDD12DRAFT_871543 [Trichophaea hybrida]